MIWDLSSQWPASHIYNNIAIFCSRWQSLTRRGQNLLDLELKISGSLDIYFSLSSWHYWLKLASTTIAAAMCGRTLYVIWNDFVYSVHLHKKNEYSCCILSWFDQDQILPLDPDALKGNTNETWLLLNMRCELEFFNQHISFPQCTVLFIWSWLKRYIYRVLRLLSQGKWSGWVSDSIICSIVTHDHSFLFLCILTPHPSTILLSCAILSSWDSNPNLSHAVTVQGTNDDLVNFGIEIVPC